MPGLDHLIPPPLIAALAGAGIWQGAQRLPEYSLTALLIEHAPKLASDFLPYKDYVAGGLAAVGVGISLSAILSFKEKETTMTPLVPSRASTLVVGGIYSHTRNPMYLGLATVLAGWSTYLDSPLVGALGIASFVGYITYFQIRPEEQALLKLFPTEFPEYMKRVRRWI